MLRWGYTGNTSITPVALPVSSSNCLVLGDCTKDQWPWKYGPEVGKLKEKKRHTTCIQKEKKLQQSPAQHRDRIKSHPEHNVANLAYTSWYEKLLVITTSYSLHKSWNFTNPLKTFSNDTVIQHLHLLTYLLFYLFTYYTFNIRCQHLNRD